MPVITCTHCGATGNAPDSILGQQVRCSKCKQSFLAEAPAEAGPITIATATEQPADEGFPSMEDVARPPSRKPVTATREDAAEPEAYSPVPPAPQPRPVASLGGGNFVEYLTFRRLAGATLVMITFWILIAGTVLGSIGLMIAGFMVGSTGLVFSGLIYLIIGPLFVRMTCEVFAVMFTMNATLQEIRDDLRKRETPPTI